MSTKDYTHINALKKLEINNTSIAAAGEEN